MDGGRKDVELTEEAAGKGNSDQRQKEEGQQSGKVGTLLAEAGIVLDGSGALVVAADLRDDGEGANIHSGIRGGVEAGGGDAVERERCERDQQIAGVSD